MSSQPKPSSAAYRYLFMALLGLVVGVIATVMLARVLQARRDPFPDSLMQVMARQTELLAASRARNRCTAPDALLRLQSLRALSSDLETAFPGLKDDRRFIQHAGDLRASLDQALVKVPADCASLQAVNDRVGEACKACHQDFR